MKLLFKKTALASLLTCGLLCSPYIMAPNNAWAQDEEEVDTEVSVDNVFVEFAPIAVSIIREYRIRGMLNVTFYLSVDKASTVDKIEELRPKLRDGLIQSLTRVANTRVNPRRPVDLELIGLFMQRSVDEILGADMAQVLIQSAAAQPS
ncbi:MAG: hypothetical protein KAR62_00805 [Sphingomonadales bacterium]|nr:hypothetical protein [Sphingomonadales bacterium]